MPEGLQYALSSKVSENPRISVVGYDAGPSLFVEKYVQEALGNCLGMGEGYKPHVHMMLFSHDASNFQLPTQVTSDDVTVYDFVRSPCEDMDSLYEAVMKNAISRPGRTHIMIIDDYAIFSVVCGCRNARLQMQFLRSINKQFRKIFLFFLKDSLSTEEIAMIYDISSDIAFLQLHPESYGTVCNSSSKFICDLLKIRPDRKVTHDKTVFQITDDEIKEELFLESSEKSGTNSSELLKNLTTFKLTLEDDEKESKNKLHLPYFEAQKTSLEDPVNYDEFEDDEEDEEV